MLKKFLFETKQKIEFKKIKKQALLIQKISNINHIDEKEKNSILKLNQNMASVINTINLKMNIEIHLEQIIGALFLLRKDAIEMKTGEGKTLVALMAALTYNIIENKQVTIVTVNDYLAKRDAFNHKEIIECFNKSVGFISKDNLNIGYKQNEYSKDIVYSSAHELGYDYLRDNLIFNLNDRVQKNRNFIIIDEIDSVLIDEASQPLTIVGSKLSKNIDFDKYIKIKNILVIEDDFEVNKDTKSIEMLESGYNKIEKELEIENIFNNNETVMELNIIINLLYVDSFIQNGREYLIEEGKLVPIDSNGRKAYGQRFKSDIQQVLEYLENIKITNDSEIIAEITYQNYFKMYESLTGMSGTLKTEEEEFAEAYNLSVYAIPVHFTNKRNDLPTFLFREKKDKDTFLVKYITNIKSKNNNPVLIGTSSIAENETIIKLLKDNNIDCISLSAKDSEEESDIIKKAGELNTVIVATNIAGRGVDIKLSKESKEAGGLIIIGYSRNITRRIDNQLIGRSGRQGDPGESLFLLSLDDILIKDFAKGATGKLIKNIMDGEKYIQSEYIEKVLLKIQSNIEDMFYESRLNLLKYDNVMKTQRESIYKLRDNVMLNENFVEIIDRNILHIIDNILKINNEDISIEELEELFNANNIQLALKTNAVMVNKSIIQRIFVDLIKRKFEGLPLNIINEILKEIYLTTIDKEWANTINKLEELRMGVSLRSIGLKDPSIEFQKDSFIIYSKMINDIKINSINTILMVELKKDKEISELKVF